LEQQLWRSFNYRTFSTLKLQIRGLLQQRKQSLNRQTQPVQAEFWRERLQ